MTIHQVLFFFFLTAMCSGNSGNDEVDAITYTGVVGGNGTIVCYFSTDKSVKFFCRNKCRDDDLLVNTTSGSDRRGRYRFNYERKASGGGSLNVTISNLTKSDAGSYKCESQKESVLKNFTIRVLDAVPVLHGSSGFVRTLTEGETFTERCDKTARGKWRRFCKGKCQEREDILLKIMNETSQNGRYSYRYEGKPPNSLYVTIAQVNKADTGWYSCAYGKASAPVSYEEFPLLVIDAPASTTQDPSNTAQPSAPASTTQDPSNTAQPSDLLPAYLLSLGIIAILVLVLLAVFLVLFYKCKTRRDSGLDALVNADSVQVEFQASVVYENWSPIQAGEDSIYQNIHPAKKDQDKCLD